LTSFYLLNFTVLTSNYFSAVIIPNSNNVSFNFVCSLIYAQKPFLPNQHNFHLIFLIILLLINDIFRQQISPHPNNWKSYIKSYLFSIISHRLVNLFSNFLGCDQVQLIFLLFGFLETTVFLIFLLNLLLLKVNPYAVRCPNFNLLFQLNFTVLTSFYLLNFTVLTSNYFSAAIIPNSNNVSFNFVCSLIYAQNPLLPNQHNFHLIFLIILLLINDIFRQQISPHPN